MNRHLLKLGLGFLMAGGVVTILDLLGNRIDFERRDGKSKCLMLNVY
jgi:hypothetical protein